MDIIYMDMQYIYIQYTIYMDIHVYEYIYGYGYAIYMDISHDISHGYHMAIMLLPVSNDPERVTPTPHSSAWVCPCVIGQAQWLECLVNTMK